jgi:hypothetical protein
VIPVTVPIGNALFSSGGLASASRDADVAVVDAVDNVDDVKLNTTEDADVIEQNENENVDVPVLKNYEVDGFDGEPTRFDGYLIGEASSRTEAHRHHGAVAPPRWRCGACRWFEVTLYRLGPKSATDRNIYLVHTRGPSTVPGEVTFRRVAFATTAYDIMKLLTQWRDERPILPEVSLNALLQAADHDSDLKSALARWLTAGA